MSWAKLDDRYDDNRKVKRAWRKDRAAIGLHAMAITYCSRHHTDGIVDIDWIEEKLHKPAERKKALAALEEAGLFDRIDDERWMVHDYLEYNPSASDSADRARDKAEAGRRGGLAKAQRKRIGEPMRRQIAADLGFSPGELGPTPCSYCLEPITVDWTDPKRVRFLDRHGAPTPEIDHVDPVSNNGAHEVANMRLACLTCNRRKGASTHLAGASASANGLPASKATPVPSRPVPSLTASSDTSDVEAIFNEWLTATGRTGKTVLNDKRRRVIRNALRDYPTVDVIDAVRGWRKSPHHRGENSSGTVYNDLELLLRDAAHIERFRDLQRDGAGQRGDRPATLADIQAAQERRSAA